MGKIYHRLQKRVNQILSNPRSLSKKDKLNVELLWRLDYRTRLEIFLDRWKRRQSRRLPEEYVKAAEIFLLLDLEPARKKLEALYSDNPRGRKPYDPVCMLRAFLLKEQLRYKSITRFAMTLRSRPRLAIIAGFDPKETPAVGTFYDFVDRIEDGKYRPASERRVKPSKYRKGRHLRNLKKEKLERKEQKKRILEKADSITQHLKEELIASSDQPRPNDFQRRLEDLLISCAIIPSAKKGFLGDLNNLVISGDGSCIRTRASSVGKPSCDCRSKGIYKCDHPRYYRDATADWGWDSYHECYYFGHTLYQHCTFVGGHNLPLHVTIGPASESDFTLSMHSLDRLIKSFRENGLEVKISAAAYDSGHDALGIYQYLNHLSIAPVIALNPRSGFPNPTGTAQKVDQDGVPLCKAGLRMRYRGHTLKNHRRIYHCPAKRQTHKEGKTIWKAWPQECPLGVLCQPDTKCGPTLYVRSDQDPRLYPPIPRKSHEFKRIMKQRTACERSNSMKKYVHQLNQPPCSSDTHYLMRLYLISILEHAKAWHAEASKEADKRAKIAI